MPRQDPTVSLQHQISRPIAQASHPLVQSARISSVWLARRQGIACQCSVTPRHIRWLVFRGVRDSLARHRACHARLIAELDGKLSHASCRELPRRLEHALDPAKSAVFEAIVY